MRRSSIYQPFGKDYLIFTNVISDNVENSDVEVSRLTVLRAKLKFTTIAKFN